MKPCKRSREEEDGVIADALSILRLRTRRRRTVSSPSDVRNYFKLELADYEHEVFCVVLLNNQHQILHKEELFRGTIDGASVYPREVAKLAMQHNAAAMFFVHNHPSGIAEPSIADKRITERLKSALALIDVRVLDHFIVASGDFYSFAENGEL